MHLNTRFPLNYITHFGRPSVVRPRDKRSHLLPMLVPSPLEHRMLKLRHAICRYRWSHATLTKCTRRRRTRTRTLHTREVRSGRSMAFRACCACALHSITIKMVHPPPLKRRHRRRQRRAATRHEQSARISAHYTQSIRRASYTSYTRYQTCLTMRHPSKIATRKKQQK